MEVVAKLPTGDWLWPGIKANNSESEEKKCFWFHFFISIFFL